LSDFNGTSGSGSSPCGRRTLLVALAGLAIIAAVAVVLWPPIDPASRITQENFERIKPGMTMAEVTAMLGPPGDYENPDSPVKFHTGDGPTFGSMMTPVDGPKSVEIWDSDTAFVSIEVDSSDTVRWGTFAPQHVPNGSLLSTALGWAKRQWHRWFP
jgi:hypothetical protein